MAKKKKILIIEDNPRIYDEFFTSLKQKYDISVSNSLESAYRMLGIYHFDLTILDVMLKPINPSVNYYRAGFEFYFSHIKLKYPLMRVIFWSSLMEDTINIFFMEKGGVPPNVHIVSKNLYPNEFKYFVDSIISSK